MRCSSSYKIYKSAPIYKFYYRTFLVKSFNFISPCIITIPYNYSFFPLRILVFLIKYWMLMHKLCKQLKFIRIPIFQIVIQLSKQEKNTRNTPAILKWEYCAISINSAGHMTHDSPAKIWFHQHATTAVTAYFFSADRIFLWNIWLRFHAAVLEYLMLIIHASAL